jgi:hypothetical protein
LKLVIHVKHIVDRTLLRLELLLLLLHRLLLCVLLD